jgi:hypothetical protein
MQVHVDYRYFNFRNSPLRKSLITLVEETKEPGVCFQ